MEEQKRKIDLKICAIVVLAIALVVCFAKLGELSDKYQSLNGSVAGYLNQINNMRGEINSIYRNVDEKLKKEASLFSGVEYTVKGISEDKGSATIEFSAVPKVIVENMKLTVNIGADSAPLEKKGNAFVGVIDVGIFEDFDSYPLLTVETDGEIKTEYLEYDFSCLYVNILPSLYANMSGSTDYSRGKLDLNLDLHIDYKPAYDTDLEATFTSFVLVEVVNGKEVGRTDLSDEFGGEDNFHTARYNKRFDISRDGTLAVYIVAEDSLGYVHKTMAYHWQGDGNSNFSEMIFDGESIYDKNGKLLCGEDVRFG